MMQNAVIICRLTNMQNQKQISLYPVIFSCVYIRKRMQKWWTENYTAPHESQYVRYVKQKHFPLGSVTCRLLTECDSSLHRNTRFIRYSNCYPILLDLAVTVECLHIKVLISWRRRWSTTVGGVKATLEMRDRKDHRWAAPNRWHTVILAL